MHHPFFVIGIARSGTNLLARMIDRHPEAVCALDPLLPYFKMLRNKIVQGEGDNSLQRQVPVDAPFLDTYFLSHGPRLLDLLTSANGRWQLAAAEQAELRRAVVDRAGLESPELAAALAKASGEDTRTFLDDMLGIIGNSKAGATRSGSKEVWAIDFLPLLARTYPQARFFLIERDPRAIVASLFAMGEQDSSQAAHFISYCRHWRKAVALARQLRADSLYASRVQIVSYERLVREPLLVAKEVCAHLGIAFREEMLEVSAGGWAGNSSYGENQGIYAQSLEKWRNALGPANIAAIEFLCAPEMALTDYGFSPDAFGILTPEIEQVFRAADSSQASWRSDIGQVSLDLGGELLRYDLIRSNLDFQDALVRECFLSVPVLQSIKAAVAEQLH